VTAVGGEFGVSPINGGAVATATAGDVATAESLSQPVNSRDVNEKHKRVDASKRRRRIIEELQ
jgi:hypothetical protein